MSKQDDELFRISHNFNTLSDRISYLERKTKTDPIAITLGGIVVILLLCLPFYIKKWVEKTENRIETLEQKMEIKNESR